MMHKKGNLFHQKRAGIVVSPGISAELIVFGAGGTSADSSYRTLAKGENKRPRAAL